MEPPLIQEAVKEASKTFRKEITEEFQLNGGEARMTFETDSIFLHQLIIHMYKFARPEIKEDVEWYVSNIDKGGHLYFEVDSLINSNKSLK